MPPYFTSGKVEYSTECSGYRSKCSHRLCPHSLELPFVDWSNKGGTQSALSEKKNYLSIFFLFCLNTTLKNQYPVKSKIWQSHPWSQSCPDFLVSRHYTPVNSHLQAVRNVRFCKHFWWQIQTTSRRICKICTKLWNFVPKCINFRTASSCLIKISPYFNSQPD